MEQSVESNFLKKFKAIASLPILRPKFSFDDVRTIFFQVLTYYGFCAMITPDRSRTEHKRADLILTIKIYNSSFM